MTTSPSTYPPPAQKSFFVEYWFVLLFAFALIALIVVYILRAITPPGPQTNTWNDITPGYSQVDDVTKQFGQPIGQESFGGGQKLSFQSDYPSRPNDVVVDQSGVVQFMKEYLPLDSEEYLQEYVLEYGQPDLVLIDTITGDAFRAYVFLKQGVVLLAHIADDSVQQKWYFAPTSAEIFLQSWGSSLTNEESGPEAFDPDLN